MRSTFYLALTVAAVMVFAACNAVDDKPNVVNTKPAATPAKAYPDGARRITPAELEAMMKNGEAFVVDVRNQDSYNLGHIPGARLIPAGDILNHVDELPRDKTIVTYCSWANEHTSAGAVVALKTKGIENAAALLGGFQTWEQERRPVEKKK